jgi:nitrite reductase/ring-hydroxylating ferredoxin subunit/uncharacterized membrane protein
MLIPFPFAFLWGAAGFDTAASVLSNDALWATGGMLLIAGIISAVVAAVPGIVDYASTVPPRSSAKTRATKHMLTNSAALVLFVVAWFTRADQVIDWGMHTLALELVGAMLLGVGGWMGGTLAYRNQIGVDHRYAESGKWNEAHVDGRGNESVVVATVDELEPNQMKLVHLDTGTSMQRIVVGRANDGFVAFDDRCPHKGGSLAGGAMMCGTVQCPWHGSQFDVQSGEVTAGPAKEKIATYPVTEHGGEVRLAVPRD